MCQLHLGFFNINFCSKITLFLNNHRMVATGGSAVALESRFVAGNGETVHDEWLIGNDNPPM